MSNAKSAPAAKSAADTLIERLAEKELRSTINPLAVEKDEEVKESIEGTKVKVIRRKTFANGAVLESYA